MYLIFVFSEGPMFNYYNLNDVEFEDLCKDIMSKMLGVELCRFAQGRDGGIDLTDDIQTKNIVVQIKHYIKSPYSALLSSLKKELEKVKQFKPKQYFICCAKELTPDNISKIRSLFSDYMDSDRNIITLIEIDDFLQNPDNHAVLKKHYKLWIESTGILQEIWNHDIFIDCESLLSDIEEEKHLFVKTEAFDEALNLLSHNKSLFITGNPGVGKTITSKMLALNFAAEGYTVRYTTDSTDLNNLKKSLSKNPEAKEIVLVDDCFGQAYFQMKENQNKELLALIKHINISKNKLLVLNSRVTIFQEAKERQPELSKCFDRGGFQIYTIDMNALSPLEKAKILYNHLAFSKIPPDYFESIRIEKRYFSIINHKNYNPRIIEYVCNPNRYSTIPANKFFSFIINQLNNPKEIWKDEYERKLQKADRILLTTIYSFSDTSTDESILRDNFEKRIETETDIDLTINQYESSLSRLSEGFIKIVDMRGKRSLSMVNPSVNDYLDSRFIDKSAEKHALLKGCTHIQQLKRLLSPNDFDNFMLDCLHSHSLDDFIFKSTEEKQAYIAYYLSVNHILDSFYTPYIKKYIKNPTDLRRIVFGRHDFYSWVIVQKLLDPELFDFYEIKDCLSDPVSMSEFLCFFDLEELVMIIDRLHDLFSENELKVLNKVFANIIEDTAVSFLLDVNAENFDDDIDINEIIEEATTYDEYDTHINETEAISTLEQQIEDVARDYVIEIISKLPKDIFCLIDQSCIDNTKVEVYGIDNIITAYMDYDDYEYTPKSTSNNSSFNEITSIFDRDICQ